MTQLDLSQKDPLVRAISPFLELGAYEALWAQDNASFKSLSELFSGNDGALPSDFVPAAKALEFAELTIEKLNASGVFDFGVRVHGGDEYPKRLRAANYPPELIYYQGWWDLMHSKISVAVVGTRTPSDAGLARTRNLVKSLVSDDITVVSGLAKGVDAEAHKTCIIAGGRTIAVLGTPLTKTYPKANSGLQREISANHLLVSQVPVNRYDMQANPTQNRHFFPQRNITMSALTDATIIIEAGQTSGTLVQAKAALKQGKLLFILDSCFKNPKLDWPHKFEDLGAIRVKNYDDIRSRVLPQTVH